MPPKLKPENSPVDPGTAAAGLLKNPQFMALFQKALGDGNVPEEGDPNREKWLRDMQAKLYQQAQEEAKKQLETPVTDEDGQWMHIMPEPGFCIKCHTVPSAGKPKEKVFINICKHPRIQEPMPMEAGENPEIADDAIRYRIPLSCGPPRPETDKAGQPCRVYDIVVNTKTIERCAEDREFRRFVAALSMSWVQQKHERTLDADEFTNVNFKCKGTPSVQRIHLRRPGEGGADMPKNAMNNEIKVPTAPGMGTAPVAPAKTLPGGKMVVEVDPEEDKRRREKQQQQQNQQAPKQEAEKKKPAFTVSKEGTYDWSSHAKPTKNPYFHETVPETVLVEVPLENRVQSIKEVDVRLAHKTVELRWIDDAADDEDCEPFLSIPIDFPFDVDSPLSAKFSKKTHLLHLRLKVVLPDEVEMEKRRSAQSKAERDAEEAAANEKKTKEQQEIAARRAKFDRMQKEEQDVMRQRKEFVENMRAVQEGAIPPMLREEIDAMPKEQAQMMLMRLESRKRNNDGIDNLLDKLPEEALFATCNCLREKLGLELKKAPPPPPPSTAQMESDNTDGDREYNSAKKSENLFGIKMYNRYVFALDH